MASNTSKECSVCNEEFNEEKNCPRILPCSHCFCTQCINKLIVRNKKSCPLCRKKFQAGSAKHFGINRNLLDLLKYVAELESRPVKRKRGEATTSLERIKDENGEISAEKLADYKRAKARIFKAKKENIILTNRVLRVNGIMIKQLQMKLNRIRMKNVKKINYLEEEHRRLNLHLDGISRREKQIRAANYKLQAAMTFKDAAPVIDETDKIYGNLKESLDELEDFISSDERTLKRLRKSTEKTKEQIIAVKDVLSIYGEGEEDDIDLIPGSVAVAQSAADEEKDENLIDFTPDDVAMAVQDTPNEPVAQYDLQKHLLSLKNLMETVEVMAFQEREGGRKRYARITVTEEDLCFVHHLEEMEVLPPNVQFIEHQDIMRVVANSWHQVFLELGVGGKSLGKLVIRLFSYENPQKNFSTLCTGAAGPSYADSNIFKVECQGHDEWENVWMGDYQCNDGRGGKAVVKGVNFMKDSNIFRSPWLKGIVTGPGLSAVESKASQFRIFTRDYAKCQLEESIGIVTSGLDILIDAISNHPDVTKIKVIDCGLVFGNRREASDVTISQ